MKSRRESRRISRERRGRAVFFLSCFCNILVIGMFSCRTLNSHCNSERVLCRLSTVQCLGLMMMINSLF